MYPTIADVGKPADAGELAAALAGGPGLHFAADAAAEAIATAGSMAAGSSTIETTGPMAIAAAGARDVGAGSAVPGCQPGGGLLAACSRTWGN